MLQTKPYSRFRLTNDSSAESGSASTTKLATAHWAADKNSAAQISTVGSHGSNYHFGLKAAVPGYSGFGRL